MTWWDHFWHDSIRDNPWSLGAMILLLLGVVAVMARIWWRTRP